MSKREARQLKRDLTPTERRRWEKAVADADGEQVQIIAQGRAVRAAHELSRGMLKQLRGERERRGLSLADMMELTGMTRESISRLENDETPNPTMLTLARYAAALGLELRFSARKG